MQRAELSAWASRRTQSPPRCPLIAFGLLRHLVELLDLLLQIGNWRRLIAVKDSLVSMDSQSLPV